MSADRWRSMAKRLLDGNGGSTVSWTRRTLTSNGPAGTVTETASTAYDVRVAQLSEESRALFQSEGWQSSQVRLVLAAKGAPFTVETHSGFPEVHFEDVVTWMGVDMRVVFISAWAAPGGKSAPPQPAVYFVGLAS